MGATPIRISALFTSGSLRDGFKAELTGMLSDAVAIGAKISDALNVGAGGKFSFEMDARFQTMSQRIREAETGLARLANSGNGVFQRLARDAAGTHAPLNNTASIIGKIGGAFRSASQLATGFAATLWSVERVARGLKDITVGPIESIIRASEDEAKFRMAMATTVSNPRAVARAVDSLSQNTSMSMSDLRRVAVGVTHTDSLQSQLSLQNPTDAMATISRMTDIIQRIQVSNPNSSAEAIQKALEGVLLGNTRGLKFTARIDSADLEAISGKSLRELEADQGLMLRTVEQLMRGRVPDSLLAQRAGLPSVAIQHAADAWTRLESSIGNDSRLLGDVSGKFRDLAETLERYLLSPEWSVRARAIGDDLGHIAKNVLDAGATLLMRASGASSKADTPSEVADQVQRLVHSLASGSDGLPTVADKAGVAIHSLTEVLQRFVGTVLMAGESIDERAAKFDSRTSLSGYFRPSSYLDAASERSRALISLVDNAVGKPVLGVRDISAIDAIEEAAKGESAAKAIGFRLPQEAFHLLTGNANTRVQQATLDDPAYGPFVDAVQKAINDKGFATRDGQYVSQRTITESILKPLAAKFGVSLAGDSSATSNATVAQIMANMSPAERQRIQMFDQFTASGVENDLSAGAGVYANKLAGLNRFSAQLGELPDTADKLVKTLDDGRAAIANIFARFSVDGGPPADFLSNLPVWQKSRIAGLMEDRSAYMGQINQFGISSKNGQDALTYINKVDEDIKLLVDGLDAAVNDALGRLKSNAGRWAVKYIGELHGEDPLVADAQISRVLAGQTDVGRRVTMAQLGVSSDLEKWFPFLSSSLPPEVFAQLGGSGTIPDEFKGRVAQEQIAARMAALKARAGYQNLGAANTIWGQGYAAQQIDFLESTGLPALQSVLTSAQAAYAKDNSSDNALALDRAAAAVAKVRDEMRQLSVESNSALTNFLKFSDSAASSIENGLGAALFDVISGTGKVSDAFRQMAASILQSFSQMAVRSLFDFGNVGSGGGQNGAGGIIGLISKFIPGLGGLGGGQASNAVMNSYPSATTSAWSVSGAANGAIWPGFRPFASGGMTASGHPVLGLIGEGKHPEAIIPMPGGRIPLGFDGSSVHAILPGNRRVPAGFVSGPGFGAFANGGIVGGSGGGLMSAGPSEIHQHLVVVDNRAEAEAYGASIPAEHILNVVSADLLRGGRVWRASQRGGGR